MINLFFSDNSIPSLDAHSTADDETAFDLELLVKLVDRVFLRSWSWKTWKWGARNANLRLCVKSFRLRASSSHIWVSYRWRISTNINLLEENFCHDIETLDRLGCRTHDTLHIFYIWSGQKNSEENKNSKLLNFILTSSYTDTQWT